MKIKIAKCTICRQPYTIKKLKEHILNSHLKYSVDLMVKEFIIHKIYDFTVNEILLIEKAYKSLGNSLDQIDIFLLDIKLKRFDQNVTRLMQTSKISQINHEYFSFSSFIENLNQSPEISRSLKKKIDETLDRIKKIYSAKISKQEYYLKTDDCIFCQERIFKSAIIDHIFKSHFSEKSQDLEAAFTYYRQQLDNEQRNWLLSIKEREQRKEERKIVASFNNRYSEIEQKIEELSKVDYAEMIDLQKELIKNQLLWLLENKKYGELEVARNRSLMKKLQGFNLILPSKEDFIKNYCQKLYVTWDDIYFERNKICISANKGFVHPIQIEGSLSILNEIKVEYFRRVFRNDVFKLIVKNGYVRKDLSKDLIKIEDQISNHINQVQKGTSWKAINHESIFKGRCEKKEILEYINTQFLKNGFLKYPATLLSPQDNVFALVEFNNSIEEEALLFIFRRDEYSFLLWENINSKRAAYVFVFENKSLDINISRITQLIVADTKYKRENLFRGVAIKEVYNISCISYKSIVHENLNDYKKQLDNILNEVN